jgi:cysteine desulfurase
LKTIYLDNAASTPLLLEVKVEHDIFLEKLVGNPSSIHTFGVRASKEVEKARDYIATALETSADNIVFTSGGTESNNWVIQSLFHQKKENQNTIITSAIEHPSVHAPIKWLQEKFGVNVIYINVDQDGRVILEELKNAISDKVFLCTIMHVNNEVGSLQPIEEISEICGHYHVPFHVDACQSFLKVPINLSKLNITYLTLNSHKVHGPKGVGALYIKANNPLSPLFHGGGHESNRRSGTLNAPAIAAFGKSVDLQFKNPDWFKKMYELNEWTRIKLSENFANISFNSPPKNLAPHILNVRFSEKMGKDVFWALNKAGVYVSTSSACSSNKMTPSHVLSAMGIEDKHNLESIRISFGLQNTYEDVEEFISTLKEIFK